MLHELLEINDEKGSFFLLQSGGFSTIDYRIQLDKGVSIEDFINEAGTNPELYGLK